MRTESAIFSVARKNGKTALIAALILVHLIGPMAEENGEIYSAANDREQAAIVYKYCAQLVRKSPLLSQYLKCVDSTKTITAQHLGSFYRAISAEAGTKHGFNPTLVIYDELSQAKGRELYDVLDTALGARENPLFIIISTQSNDPQHILSELIDDGISGRDPSIVAHLYAAPEECDLTDESAWYAANPALGDFRKMKEFQTKLRKAIALPSFEAAFRNLYLNQRVNPQTPFIARSVWMARAGDVEFDPGERLFIGLDLSSRKDLTALVAMSAGETSKVRAWFWKPEAVLREQSEEDFGPGSTQYLQWVKDGHLLSVPGPVIHYGAIAKVLDNLAKSYKIIGVAYDRWRINDLMSAMEDEGIAARNTDRGTGIRFHEWGQGFRDMSPAIEALEAEILGKSLIHNNNPVLNWNMANAIAVMDASGSRKLDKAKTRFRIDGAQALTMAAGLRARIDEKPSGNLDGYLAFLGGANA